MGITRSLGNPKRKVWCSKATVYLDYKIKVIESSRTWRRLSEVSTTPFTIIDVDLHTIINKYFAPNETERLSISPACWTQRIKCASVKYEESEIWPASKWWWKAIKMVANNVGNSTGVHNSLEVSLQKTYMMGKQITAWQLSELWVHNIAIIKQFTLLKSWWSTTFQHHR